MSASVRVIVVDDHPLLRAGVVATLAGAAGFEIVGEAASGDEAVRLAALTRPDLVLLDVGLPDCDGVEVISSIARQSPDTRIAMLTVADDSDTIVAAMRAGAVGYLLKGISGSELISAVRRVSSGQAYASPEAAFQALNRLSERQDQEAADLTDRELSVLDLLAQGLTNREIGRELFLSEKTVKHHVTVILQKLNLRNRVEAALFASARAPAKRLH